MANTFGEDTAGRWADDGGAMAKATARTEAGSATGPRASTVHREPPRLIRVNGEYLSKTGCGHCKEYGQYGLKHAILYFLDELLAGELDGLPAPHIAFGPVTLKLRKDEVFGAKYIAYGEPVRDVVPQEWLVDGTPKSRTEIALLSLSNADELEHNLRKFALNKRWRMLEVYDSGSVLWIWKMEVGGYGILTYNLPKTEEEWNNWHPYS
ncbi:MAG: hypothetical protein HYW56_01760 [Candidatus Harrisonbacteria bacterium]|nr:hypothetical protein [Candidatus Harrisonbacteria bacterium]